MKLLTGQALIDFVRKFCNAATRRIWIVSPFIGSWSDVRRIIGIKWVNNGDLNFRLITEKTAMSNRNQKTLYCFHDNGEIKSLKGLHAKAYIIDNSVIITSANLTGTAFFKRHEIGILVDKIEARSLVQLYEYWWDELCEPVLLEQISKIVKKKGRRVREDMLGQHLSMLWNRPKDPGDPYTGVNSEFRDYNKFMEYYKDFASIYQNIQRLWPKASLYFETDAFLNYLYHHAPGTPSRKFRDVNPRVLNSDRRKKEIRMYATLFKKWIATGSEGVEEKPYRQRSSAIIRRLLNRNHILQINRKDVALIADQFQSLNSYAIMKAKFLNPKNNSISRIRNAWYVLLYGDDSLPVKMHKCNKMLNFFGKSSIQELIGFCMPTKYPARNRNTNAGLRFLGYDVSAY